MHTIIYILKKRSQHLFDKENNAELVLIVMSMVGFFYIPKLLSPALQSSNGGMHLATLYIIANLILFTPLLSLFFPTFESKRNLLPTYLPFAKGELFILDFICTLGKRAFLSIVSMTIGFFVYFNFANTLDYLSIGLSAIISLLFVDAITNILSWQKHPWWAAILTVAAISLLPKWIHASIKQTLLLQISSITLLCVTVWKTYSVKAPRSKSSGSVTPSNNRRILTILLKEISRNNLAKKSIALIFVLKVFILFVMPYFSEKYQVATELPVIYLLFLSPFFLFASIFNNSFGFFRSLFFTIWLYDNRPGQFIRIFARLLLPFILADTLLSMLFLVWFKLFIWQNVVVYVSSTLYLIIVAAMTSCLIPMKLEQRTLSGMKKGSSTWASLISMVPLYFILIFHLKQTYPTQLICLGIAIIVLIVALKVFGRRWQMKILQTIR